MIHIMMDINEHQDQRYTRGDNNGRDLYLLGVNVLVDMYVQSEPRTRRMQLIGDRYATIPYLPIATGTWNAPIGYRSDLSPSIFLFLSLLPSPTCQG